VSEFVSGTRNALRSRTTPTNTLPPTPTRAASREWNAQMTGNFPPDC